MAKDKQISFRIESAIVNRLDSIYTSANTASQRITEALPYLRDKTLDEIRGKFTLDELCYLIDMMATMQLDPIFATQKPAVIQAVEDSYRFKTAGRDWPVSMRHFLPELETLTAVQLFFLLDFCKTFHQKHNGQGIPEYAGYLA